MTSKVKRLKPYSLVWFLSHDLTTDFYGVVINLEYPVGFSSSYLATARCYRTVYTKDGWAYSKELNKDFMFTDEDIGKIVFLSHKDLEKAIKKIMSMAGI